MTRWLVVGAGAAGCVVASRLSEDPANHVVVVEAGPADPTGACDDQIATLDETVPERGDCDVIRRQGGRPERYRQGFGVGGSSLINGGVVVDVDGPGAAGHGPARGAGSRHLLPLESPPRSGGLGAAVLAAAADARQVRLVRRDGRRVTAADVYLRPALSRPNVVLHADAPVQRIHFESRRAVGVVTADGVEHVGDRVVCCAGAIHTPALLLRSGVDTPGVGVGLQDHPALAIALDLEPGAVDPAAAPITVAIDRPGRQLLAINHLPGRPALGLVMAAVTRVSSAGRVSLPDLAGPPVVELNQLATADDLDALVGVVGEAFDLLDRAPLRAAIAAASIDDRGTPASEIVGRPDAIRRWLGGHLTGYHHVAASCRQGVVTEDDGALRGYAAIHVCDASVFTRVPAHNPYLSVVLLAERMSAGWL
jgi:choline dehydrogenase/5-(hydroxymethyl)furfural/furfural oxidase